MGLAQDLDDQGQTQMAHYFRGAVATFRSEPTAAEHLAAARRLAERTGDDMDLVGIGCDQGALAMARGQGEEARRALEEVVPAADAFQPIYAARARCLLAEVAVHRGDRAEARRLLDDALALPLADQLFHATRAQARLARARGDQHLAAKLADEGLGSSHRAGAQLLVVDFLELAALLAADTEMYTEAGRLLASTTPAEDEAGEAARPPGGPV
jgi:ATP/maltotriose-dependent transcriptional regulator MalT